MNGRVRRSQLAAAIAILVMATSVLSYRWITSSRPVTTAAAVEEYRSQASARSAQIPDATPAATSTPAQSDSVVPLETAAPKLRLPAAAPRRAETPPTAWWHRPASGVYTFATTGFEKATFSRDYPPESQRIVDTDHGRYENHHIFSREHEEWFSLRATKRGGEMLNRRMRITFGPVTVDDTITFDPPLLGVPVPYRRGQVWSGSWEGDTAGSYRGETIGHRTIAVGGERVEVWINQLRLELRGKISGKAQMNVWYAPRLGMFARENGIYDLRSQGVPFSYHTEYTITLTSTQPRS